MIDAAILALRDILSPPFRGVLMKALALTVVLLAALWLLVEWLVAHYVVTPWPWLDAALAIMTGVGLIVGLGFLVAPVAALFAGLFLDDIAAIVERTHYPPTRPAARSRSSPPSSPRLDSSASFFWSTRSRCRSS